jgi:hypothetical protein
LVILEGPENPSFKLYNMAYWAAKLRRNNCVVPPTLSLQILSCLLRLCYHHKGQNM